MTRGTFEAGLRSMSLQSLLREKPKRSSDVGVIIATHELSGCSEHPQGVNDSNFKFALYDQEDSSKFHKSSQMSACNQLNKNNQNEKMSYKHNHHINAVDKKSMMGSGRSSIQKVPLVERITTSNRKRTKQKYVRTHSRQSPDLDHLLYENDAFGRTH